MPNFGGIEGLMTDAIPPFCWGSHYFKGFFQPPLKLASGG